MLVVQRSILLALALCLLSLAFQWTILHIMDSGYRLPKYQKTSNNVRQIITLSNDTKYGVNETKLLSSLPADGIPRVLIVNSCSGSTVIFKITKQILEAHGYNVRHGGEPLLDRKPHIMEKARKNLIKKGFEAKIHRKPNLAELFAEILRMYNEEAIKYNKILLFKIKSLENDEVVDALKKLGAKFAYSYRGKLLNRAICTTRDCFKTGLGYQVHVNGTEAETCFGRRDNDDEKFMAHFNNTKKLIKMMKNWQRIDIRKERDYMSLYHPAESTAYEDLFQFVYTANDKVFNDAVKVWCAFLKTFGGLKEPVVKGVLHEYKNSRSPPPPLNETIYNFDENFKLVHDGVILRFDTGPVAPALKYLHFKAHVNPKRNLSLDSPGHRSHRLTILIVLKTLQAMVAAVLKKRIPRHDDLLMNIWYGDNKGKDCWQVLQHRLVQALPTIFPFDAIGIIGKAGEAARLREKKGLQRGGNGQTLSYSSRESSQTLSPWKLRVT